MNGLVGSLEMWWSGLLKLALRVKARDKAMRCDLSTGVTKKNYTGLDGKGESPLLAAPAK